jgi:cytochrome c
MCFLFFHKWYHYQTKSLGREVFWKQCLKCHKVKSVGSRRCNYFESKKLYFPKKISNNIIFWHNHELNKDYKTVAANHKRIVAEYKLIKK